LVWIGFMSVIGGLLYARRNRILEHAERMKAIEMGRPWPLDKATMDAAAVAQAAAAEHSPERMGHTLAVKVPLGALGIALAASFFLGRSVDELAWIAAGAVGVSGVVCGTLLTRHQITARESAQATAYEPKPAVDPDAFDVVSRRG